MVLVIMQSDLSGEHFGVHKNKKLEDKIIWLVGKVVVNAGLCLAGVKPPLTPPRLNDTIRYGTYFDIRRAC